MLECHVCQVNRYENVANPGLLQPLPSPHQAWSHISMDFREQFPLSAKEDTIWIVVDRFTKYRHFIVLAYPYSASTLATVFLDIIYKLHGLPQSIVSDGDKVLTNQFLKQLFHLIGVEQHLRTGYHPQIDG